uniref:PRKR interacting protein 1 n=1 Tax=Cyprinus carpio carpio TaxID=630221 RepID=A0A8C1BNP6_CYPCA
MAVDKKDARSGKATKKESQPLIIAKTPAEQQRLKLERLMRNPDKSAPIPEKPKEWNPRGPPEFVRDVMGSSAGAGSGEFHVYRHLRRREYQRQDFLERISEKWNVGPPVICSGLHGRIWVCRQQRWICSALSSQQTLDEKYIEKVKENQKAAEERTVKRRKKREKLKQKKLAKKAKMESQKEGSEEKSSSSASEAEEQEDDAEVPSFIMGKR